MKNEPEIVHQSDQFNSGDIPDFVSKWYGWGSPIGLSIVLIALGVVAVLIRIALVGLK